jgi:hypothetical protein
VIKEKSSDSRYHSGREGDTWVISQSYERGATARSTEISLAFFSLQSITDVDDLFGQSIHLMSHLLRGFWASD